MKKWFQKSAAAPQLEAKPTTQTAVEEVPPCPWCGASLPYLAESPKQCCRNYWRTVYPPGLS
jgi:hypothetical protein